MTNDRRVPLIVAVALFMENMDATVIATSLPAIAADIGTSPLALKLAVTSYLLSLAVFIPASGWTADRFGARTVFAAAIAVFVAGSIGCAMANSLTDFVIARIVQGMGGAMMTPIGRLVLVRTIDRRELVKAMVWVTFPALIGPVMGPPVGGFITTYFSWHWIFLINVPIGLIGILLVGRYIENIRAEAHEPFDARGMVLAGLGVGGLAFGLSVLGLDYLPWPAVAALIGGGALASIAYLAHARRTAAPVLDLKLLKFATFRASIVGGFVFRVGVGALPFLLPLLLQVGFDFTPFQSGLITFSSALGAMTMKAAIAPTLRHFGFRNVLTVNAVISSLFLAACATFTPGTPVAVMIAVLLVGGFFRSLEFTSINTIAYAEIEPRLMGRATALASVAQQLSLSMGVAIGALAVDLTVQFKRQPDITAADLRPPSSWWRRFPPWRRSCSGACRRRPAPSSPTAPRRRPNPPISGWVNAENLSVTLNRRAAGGDQSSSIDGADHVWGNGGNDTFTGSPGGDTLNGGDHIDTVVYGSLDGILEPIGMRVEVDLATGVGRFGNAEGDTLISIENVIGTGSDDTITGDGNANRLTGGGGGDILRGGGGGDTFAYRMIHDGTMTSFDDIADFNRAEGDRIDLSLIDANGSAAGEGMFDWVETGPTGVRGQLWVDPAGTTSWNVYGDTDGDRVADFRLRVYVAPIEGDFVM